MSQLASPKFRICFFILEECRLFYLGFKHQCEYKQYCKNKIIQLNNTHQPEINPARDHSMDVLKDRCIMIDLKLHKLNEAITWAENVSAQ